MPLAERRSGYEQMGLETRAMQDDDTANPAMLWVLEGEALWKRKTGNSNRACSDCHGNAGISMKGVAARYPAPDEISGRLMNLEQRVNACRVENQKAKPLAFESRELLALAAYVGLGSLQRRLRNCMSGVRAEAYEYSAPELVELEYYLMWRARGMKVETPAVRP